MGARAQTKEEEGPQEAAAAAAAVLMASFASARPVRARPRRRHAMFRERPDAARLGSAGEEAEGRQLAAPLWATRTGSRELLVAEDFELSYGGSLPEVRLTVEEWGDTSLGPDRTIAIFPSFSHGHHVASNAADPSPGWWEEMVGPGRWIDTNRFRVVCTSVLGSPMGSTSPRSVDPRTGEPFRMSFPTVTTADQARAHALALEKLGLGRVHAAVGASLGGMQVLQFATLFPDRVDRLAVLSSTGQTSPGSVALRRVQRQAIMADPEWRAGRYEGSGPVAGLRVARELGMAVYRSREEFDSRFDWRPTSPQGRPDDVTFDVESYLSHQGAKFAEAQTMDANSYLILSKCMDLHSITNPRHASAPRSLDEAASAIRASALLIGVDQDVLTPARELETLAASIRGGGGEAEFVSLDSHFGHDAFLKEFDRMGPLLREHVEAGLRDELALEEAHTTGLSAP